MNIEILSLARQMATNRFSLGLYVAFDYEKSQCQLLCNK